MKSLARSLGLLFFASVGLADQPESEKLAARELRELGLHVFIDLDSGRVDEVNGNGNERLTDADFTRVADLPMLTDLSLERTAIGDSGLKHVAGLTNLEWLNLYRTNVGDAGLENFVGLEKLQQLPIGETRVTDAGLPRIAKLKSLIYLGLRGNAITDAGLADLEGMTELTGLHLGQTEVSDRGLKGLNKLVNLERLWLHDTAVTNDGVQQLLANLSSLRELHLQRTRLTIDAIRELREAHPDCRIFYESDPVSSQSTESPSRPDQQPEPSAQP
jgi:Leucine-rich repeat (LRR) protein